MGSKKQEQRTSLAVATLPACLAIGVLGVLIGTWSILVNRTVSAPYLVSRGCDVRIDMLLICHLG